MTSTPTFTGAMIEVLGEERFGALMEEEIAKAEVSTWEAYRHMSRRGLPVLSTVVKRRIWAVAHA